MLSTSINWVLYSCKQQDIDLKSVTKYRFNEQKSTILNCRTSNILKKNVREYRNFYIYDTHKSQKEEINLARNTWVIE